MYKLAFMGYLLDIGSHSEMIKRSKHYFKKYGYCCEIKRVYRRTPVRSNTMIQTKNFNSISDPKLLCTCGHPDCDKRSVNQITLNRAQIGRNILKHSLTVNSGGRCPNHTDEAHRTTPADHQKGNGIDVSVTGATRGNVVQAGIQAGFNAIGVAKTFVHLGYREELPEGHLTMWVY